MCSYSTLPLDEEAEVLDDENEHDNDGMESDDANVCYPYSLGISLY